MIDEAMAEVEACREANARLDAGRAALREAVTTREELAELLGGEARLKRSVPNTPHHGRLRKSHRNRRASGRRPQRPF